MNRTNLDSTDSSSSSNKSKYDGAPSNFGYLSGYTKPEDISWQVKRLQELFPGIGYANTKLANRPVPESAEGHFVIPRWDRIASTRGKALQIVLALIKRDRKGKLVNYRSGQIDSKHLKLLCQTEIAFQRLCEAQRNYNLLVFPAQFGIHHRGRSPDRVRELCLNNKLGGEFALDAFTVSVMLLTHPRRLQRSNDLWPDCTGDQFDTREGFFRFTHTPCFRFVHNRLEFGTGFTGNSIDRFGSATGFLSKEV